MQLAIIMVTVDRTLLWTLVSCDRPSRGAEYEVLSRMVVSYGSRRREGLSIECVGRDRIHLAQLVTMVLTMELTLSGLTVWLTMII